MNFATMTQPPNQWKGYSVGDPWITRPHENTIRFMSNLIGPPRRWFANLRAIEIAWFGCLSSGRMKTASDKVEL